MTEALDSQSVKTTESGGPSGYDAGKKVKGRKRQVMVDTDGRGLILEPQAASVQDRDGAPLVLRDALAIDHDESVVDRLEQAAVAPRRKPAERGAPRRQIIRCQSALNFDP